MISEIEQEPQRSDEVCAWATLLNVHEPILAGGSEYFAVLPHLVKVSQDVVGVSCLRPSWSSSTLKKYGTRFFSPRSPASPEARFST